MNRSNFMIMAAVAFLAGCSSVSVNNDYDPIFDFSTLKTYAWQHEVQPETGNPRIDNDLNDKRIRHAVEANLEAKGFVKAEKEGADFQVAYFMDFQQRIDGSGSSLSFGVGSGSYGRSSAVGWSSGGNVSDYEESQLTIDIINPETAEMVWRGRGRRRASSTSDPVKITAYVDDAVLRIFKKFPPKKK